MFTLNEALEVIKDKPEFAVNQRDHFTVIDYNLQTATTFVADSVRDKLILCNLRGTAFDETGKIISLPLHKFHNLNECPGYLESEIDFSEPHTVMLKLDGSMIRPIPMGGAFRLGTRAGVTDVSMMAENWLAEDSVRYSRYARLIRDCIELGVTPVFEFTSRLNKVVVDYPEPELTLLAIRDNNSGAYVQYFKLEILAQRYNIPIVRVFDSKTLKLSDVRAWDKDEGVVVAFDSGFRVKVKADAYVTKHRAKDLVRFEKDVVRLILEDKLDDVLPLVDDDVRMKLIVYRDSLTEQMQHYSADLALFMIANYFNENPPTRAQFAFLVRGDQNAKFYFRLLDGKSDGLKEHLLSGCSSGPKLAEMLEKFNFVRWL